MSIEEEVRGMKTRSRANKEPVFPSVAKNMTEYRKNAFRITGKKAKNNDKNSST